MVKPAARLSVVVGDVAANYDGRVVVAPTGQAVDRDDPPAVAVAHRIAARRLGDGARAAFSGDYLHEHITHGYAITVHASQGTTAHSTHAVLGDNTSRATLYVAMTPARESNTAYLCERTAGEGARVDLAGWDLWVSGKAEAMSDEKSASPVWCRVGARCDHRGKRSCW